MATPPAVAHFDCSTAATEEARKHQHSGGINRQTVDPDSFIKLVPLAVETFGRIGTVY